jgi:hypothetical protein
MTSSSAPSRTARSADFEAAGVGGAARVREWAADLGGGFPAVARAATTLGRAEERRRIEKRHIMLVGNVSYKTNI